MISEDTASRNIGILLVSSIALFIVNWGLCVGGTGSDKCEPQLDKAAAAIGGAVSTYLAFIYRRKENNSNLTGEPIAPQFQGLPVPQAPTRPPQAPQEGGLAPRLPLVDPPRGEEASEGVLSGAGEWRGR